ncbi:MAG: inverse autotransporter beta domain-containing protein, partial [Candidatus Theseobacter exili]|nr:inverse autotransporter beta domain-containing protein [Candidatus Theseobacter exili]
MKRMLRVLSVTAVLAISQSVYAQDVPSVAPACEAVVVNQSTLPAAAVTFGGKFSSDSNLGYVDVLAPFAGNDIGFLFLDPRVSIAEGSENEQNIGLGARKLIMDEKLIIGGNVFYDSRETSNNNRFGQVGAGLEFLTEWVDARVNGYWPSDDKETIDSYDTQQQDVSIVNYWNTSYF